MAREKFDRSLPHINVGTIGHVDHGKTTLSAALTKVCADTFGGEAVAFDGIDNAPEEKERGITIATSHVEYSSNDRHYAQCRLSRSRRLCKKYDYRCCTNGWCNISCKCKTDGPMPQTREHILLASKLVYQISLFILTKPTWLTMKSY